MKLFAVDGFADSEGIREEGHPSMQDVCLLCGPPRIFSVWSGLLDPSSSFGTLSTRSVHSRCTKATAFSALCIKPNKINKVCC